MRDEIGLDASGLLQELGQAAEQLVVRDRFERALMFHRRNMGRAFSTSWEGGGRPLRTRGGMDPDGQPEKHQQEPTVGVSKSSDLVPNAPDHCLPSQPCFG